MSDLISGNALAMSENRDLSAERRDVRPPELTAEQLRARLQELEETLRAIREGEVDALVVSGRGGKRVFTLQGADHVYRVLVEGMREGAVTFNHQGHILYSNRRFAEMVGRPAATLIGIPIASVFGPRERERFSRIVKEASLGASSGEATLERSDGSRFSVQLSISPLEIEGWTISCMVLTDLSVIKQAEEKLRRAHLELEKRVNERTMDLSRSNAELEQFAYVASHDLQEPLRKVTLFIEMLSLKNPGLAPESSQYIEQALKGIDRMRSLIRDLLAFSGVTRAETKLDNVDLNEVVVQVLGDLEETIKLKKAQVSTVSLPEFVGNRFHMYQLFQNLIGNALKFNDGDQPTVRISAEKVNGEFQIGIHDNGIGIEEQYLSRIFKVFQRLHGKHQYPGNGIGLATCQRIVQQYAGRIWVESTPGKGSSFFFTFSAP